MYIIHILKEKRHSLLRCLLWSLLLVAVSWAGLVYSERPAAEPLIPLSEDGHLLLDNTQLYISRYDGVETAVYSVPAPCNALETLAHTVNACSYTPVVGKWTPAYPVYSVCFQMPEDYFPEYGSRMMPFAFSGMHLILPDGRVMRLDRHLTAALQEICAEGDLSTQFTGPYRLDPPVPLALALHDPPGFDPAFLAPTPEELAPDGLEVTLVAADASCVTVQICNRSDALQDGFSSATLSLQIDGVFYKVPRRNKVGFMIENRALQPGESTTLQVDLSIFWGALPSGVYRLSFGRAAVAFRI